MLFFFMFFFLVNSEASEPLRSLSLLNATHFICQANYFGQLEIILNDAHASAKLTVSETDVQEFINDSATTKNLFRVPWL